MIRGNVNFNAVDPFNNPYKVRRDKNWPFPNSSVQKSSPVTQIELDAQTKSKAIHLDTHTETIEIKTDL